ncbi:MAG: endopeptidase La, partial [Oscillospiraceae bacterium]|nr:endopeptidase La [Oscillospiraceae bacterium]
TGVVASIKQVLRLPNDSVRILVEGLYRARIQSVVKNEDFPLVVCKECPTTRVLGKLRREALLRECRERVEAYAKFSDALTPAMRRDIAAADEVGILADFVAANLPFPAENKQALLDTFSGEKRMEQLLLLLAKETAVLELEDKIHKQVHEQMDQNQKEYYLREQLRAISTELGDEDNPTEEAEEYRARIEALPLKEDVRDKLLKECKKLSKMPPGSHEGTVSRHYLDACLELPWDTLTQDNLDLAHAKEVLDRDHYGMEKIKERVLEILAVRQLSKETMGQIICFVGPPGVGKTSIAKSIAEAMGRKYVRVSLGGVRDEADIRGHRKTYIGAMPGRIMNAMQLAGSANPLMLLDEIDKMSLDFHGDPASAMLEVLDTEQNVAFVDHYLEVPFNLSRVLFITTANDLDGVPPPLIDRMDVIELSSYTAEEKFHIAKEHLLKKQLAKNGLTARQMALPDDALRAIIDGYTREAGVRQLERVIGKLCRKCAKKLVSGRRRVTVTVSSLEGLLGPRRYKPDAVQKIDEVGVVNGLAWTAVGGEMMPIEVAVLDGNGKIELTGSLGDVMKESARTAISYVRSRAADWHIERDFYKNKDIHIHVPEGAVPKDGPSAGVTMATAIVSALTGVPVRRDVAMTGEITLRGHVLPIGGLREKTMAAYTHHIKTVLIPEDNAPDLAEVDAAVKAKLKFIPVNNLDAVISAAMPPLET